MRTIFSKCLVLPLVFLVCANLDAEEVVALFSKKIPAHQLVMDAFNFSMAAENHHVFPVTLEKKSDRVLKELFATGGNFVFSIGDASASVGVDSGLPGVYCGIYDTAPYLNGQGLPKNNLTGVLIVPKPELVASVLKQLLDKRKRVALIFRPPFQPVADSYKTTLEPLGFSISAIPVLEKEDVHQAIKQNFESMDFVLALDPIVFISSVTRYLLSLNIPLVSFSPALVERGESVLGFFPQNGKLGTQSADLLNEVIHAGKGSAIPPQLAKSMDYAINLELARHLNLSVSPALRKDAVALYDGSGLVSQQNESQSQPKARVSDEGPSRRKAELNMGRN